MPRKKAKSLDRNWVQRSIREFRDLDPRRRILHAYQISQDVDEYAKSDKDAMDKLVQITGDMAVARRLQRLHTLPRKKIIDKAVQHLAAKKREAAKARTKSIDEARGRRRSPNSAKVSNGSGISRTHLLTLAGIEDLEKRNQLFRDSIENNWTTAELKRQARGFSETERPVRPTEITYTASVKVGEITEWLGHFVAKKLPEATTSVKPTERKRAIKQCDSAIQELKKLQKRIDSSIDILTKSKQRLKKQTS